MAEYGGWELNVHEIKGKMDRGELIPDPDWQRGYIWKLQDEQLLIDSILKQLPIPKFYLTEEYDPKKGVSIHYVVDGQQRIKAIYKFLSSKLSIEVDGKHYCFKDLIPSLQQKITTYKINGHYLRNYTQADINFLFQRLNRTGIKLTNMEIWNNDYYNTEILKLIREIHEEIFGIPYKKDLDARLLKQIKDSYISPIYTEENIQRLLPADDIIDLCNCLQKNSVEGGSKKELTSFLNNNNKKNLSAFALERSQIKLKFRKTLNSVKQIFPKQDIESSLFGKRTHFISLFLSVGLAIHEYYICANIDQLNKDLLDFIENQPEEYKESVLGGIRSKAAREIRVRNFTKIIRKYAIKLDKKRFFNEALRQKFWRKCNHVCKICKKRIKNYTNATLDHRIPWAKGGKTLESNAQLAHNKCNQQKRNKYEEFIIA